MYVPYKTYHFAISYRFGYVVSALYQQHVIRFGQVMVMVCWEVLMLVAVGVGRSFPVDGSFHPFHCRLVSVVRCTGLVVGWLGTVHHTRAFQFVWQLSLSLLELLELELLELELIRSRSSME